MKIIKNPLFWSGTKNQVSSVIGNTYFNLPMQDISGRDIFVIREGRIDIFKPTQLTNLPDLGTKFLYRLQGAYETIVYEYLNDWLVVLLGDDFKGYYIVPQETKLFE